MFEGLPDDSKLWVFCFSTPATPEQEELLQQSLCGFVAGWRAHGASVSGAYELLEGRFLLVASDSRGAAVSGCSIDSMFQAVSDAAERCGLAIADPATIFFRGEAGRVNALPRSEFKAIAKSSGFDRKTHVFNPVLSTVAELRNSGFELPFESAWHARAFG